MTFSPSTRGTRATCSVLPFLQTGQRTPRAVLAIVASVQAREPGVEFDLAFLPIHRRVAVQAVHQCLSGQAVDVLQDVAVLGLSRLEVAVRCRAGAGP